MIWTFVYLYNCVDAIGMTIPPVIVGDQKKYSSLNYLYNCMSYSTVKDDIIMVHINSGNVIASQNLHLHIFDSESNKLRYKKSISQNLDLIFTNLNNPTQFDDSNGLLKRTNILNKFHFGSNSGSDDKNHPGLRSSNDESAQELLNSDKGKSLIYICFDNLYSDKSWSFKPKPRDVEISVEIKNMTSMKQTNYETYAKYFQRKVEDSKTTFDEKDFDKKIKLIDAQLKEATENLKSLEVILSDLLIQEHKLRDVNESIFSRYTMVSILFLIAIFLFGLVQLIYFKCYLKKTKVL